MPTVSEIAGTVRMLGFSARNAHDLLEKRKVSDLMREVIDLYAIEIWTRLLTSADLKPRAKSYLLEKAFEVIDHVRKERADGKYKMPQVVVPAHELEGFDFAVLFFAPQPADVYRQLVERGYNINAHDRHGSLPLTYAALGADIESLGGLLMAGANINGVTTGGLTAITIVSEIDSVAAKQCICLLNGADLELGRVNAVHVAARENLMLISSWPTFHVHAQNPHGATRLMIELDDYYDYDPQWSDGNVGLARAKIASRDRVVGDLIALTVNFDIQDRDGNTVLMYMLGSFRYEVAKALLDLAKIPMSQVRLDTSLRNIHGQTALDFLRAPREILSETQVFIEELQDEYEKYEPALRRALE